MLYSIKDREDTEVLDKLVSLENQVQEVGLKDKLDKKNYHHKTEKLFEPVTDTIKNTSENLTKATTESFIMNVKALNNLNDNFSGKNNDRSILASHLLTIYLKNQS